MTYHLCLVCCNCEMDNYVCTYAISQFINYGVRVAVNCTLDLYVDLFLVQGIHDPQPLIESGL